LFPFPAGQAVFSADGSTLASLGENTVDVWKLGEAKLKERALAHTEAVSVISLSQDGRLLACSQNEAVRLWDLSGSEAKSQDLATKVGRIQSLTFSPDSRWLVVGGVNRRLQVWDLSGATPKEHALLPLSSNWRSLAFSADGKLLAACNATEGVFLVDATTWKLRQKWSLTGVVNQVAFIGDNRHLALGNVNGTTYILRLATPLQAAAP
jgi:WD40 repeat protein